MEAKIENMEKQENVNKSFTSKEYTTLLINMCLIILGLHYMISYWFLTKLLHLWGINPDDVIVWDDIYFAISSVNYNMFIFAGSIYLLYFYYYVVSNVDLFEVTTQKYLFAKSWTRKLWQSASVNKKCLLVFLLLLVLAGFGLYAYKYYIPLLYIIFTIALIFTPQKHKRKAFVIVGICLVLCIMMLYNHFMYKEPAEENKTETVVYLQDRILTTSPHYVLVFRGRGFYVFKDMVNEEIETVPASEVKSTVTRKKINSAL